MAKLYIPILIGLLSISGCSTIGDWFDEPDETITQLVEIDKQFSNKVVWQYTVGPGSEFFSRLTPVIAYDKIYSADRSGVVAARNVDSGELIWEVNYPSSQKQGWINVFSDNGSSENISGGMSAAFSKVVFATENGKVVALDAETGELQWESAVSGEVLTAPTLDVNLVIVSTLNGRVVAVDANDGKEVWSYADEVPALSLRGASSVVSVGGGIIFGTAAGKLTVLLAKDGQLAWDKSISSKKGRTELDRIADIDAKPLVMGGIVYVSSFDGTLAALELRSGRVIWKREYQSYQPISVSSNTLFVVDKDSTVYALDRLSGVELWSQSDLKGRGLTAATPDSGHVVVADSFGYLHWLSEESGALTSRLNIEDARNGYNVAPIKYNDKLFVQSRNGKIFAVERQ